MMRRVACIALPEIRVEIVRHREKPGRAVAPSASPLAIVVARPGGAVASEREVLGNTRIDVVSREARAFGVRPGQTVAAARAKCAGLHLRVIEEGAVQAALVRIAEASLAIGPTTAFDIARDLVWVEVGGCAHLHGGEEELARTLEGCVRMLGHTCRVAVADGPRIAAAVATFAPLSKKRRRDETASLLVEPGKGAQAMRELPIAALGLGAAATAWLAELGLSTCGDVQKLPRRSLGTRLGARVHEVMQILDGEDRAPLDAWRPPEQPEERFELDCGAQSTEAMEFVLELLAARLAARLEGRAMAASRLELELGLDRALCAPGTSHKQVLTIALPAPIARADDLRAVLRACLDHHELAAPVLAVTLRAPELACGSSSTLDMLSPEPEACRMLPRLVAELGAELGISRVGTLGLVDTWMPDERTRLVPFRAPLQGSRSTSSHVLTTSALEPTRLVEAISLDRSSLVDTKWLARIEAIGWWPSGQSTTGPREASTNTHIGVSVYSSARASDWVAAWVGSVRGGVHAQGWIELTPDDARLRGWVD